MQAIDEEEIHSIDWDRQHNFLPLCRDRDRGSRSICSIGGGRRRGRRSLLQPCRVDDLFPTGGHVQLHLGHGVVVVARQQVLVREEHRGPAHVALLVVVPDRVGRQPPPGDQLVHAAVVSFVVKHQKTAHKLSVVEQNIRRYKKKFLQKRRIWYNIQLWLPWLHNSPRRRCMIYKMAFFL
jgi:hypothetical protein